MGAWSHWRAVRSVPGTPFQSNGPGTAAAVGRRRPGRGSRSPPKFSSAIRCRVAASTRFSSCFFFPPSLSLSFFPLTPADSFSRQRHNHGYLIRPYFLIAMGRWGEKQPGCRPRLAGEGKGGNHAKSPNSLCHLPEIVAAPTTTWHSRAPPPRRPHPQPQPPHHLCLPYLKTLNAGVGSKLGHVNRAL